MTENKIVIEATVEEIGDLLDMGDDGAGVSLRTERGKAHRYGHILTGREALIAAKWLRPYHRVQVTIKPLDPDVASGKQTKRELEELRRRCLSVFTIGPDTFIAYDENDAWLLLGEHTGTPRGGEDYADEVAVEIDGDRPLKIRLEEGKPEAETLSAADWCAREGRGFLCSTEW